MKRIDTVYKRLIELTREKGITAEALAEDLGLLRANVSSDLNQLWQEQKAGKEGTKPVYYRAVVSDQERLQPALDHFVRENPSLLQAVEQAKAAVLYPPNGMHMMLLGETGVGKSMFAELVYQYGRDMCCLVENAPFIIFNCSDYTNNPQLLVSQLFGSLKGAYTGSVADKPGLMEKADGGVLFLDEIHRLPPEGQEMLFSYLDRGTFRRLGETDCERSVNVRILCATTENPDSSLLQTFNRRIPMTIHIPSLKERSVRERLNLTARFFQNESARLVQPVHVSVNSLRALMGYDCPGNIGQLKSNIQLLCARAYSQYISKKKRDINIVSMDLPPYMTSGLLDQVGSREVWSGFLDINSRFCTFDSAQAEWRYPYMEDSVSVYDMIDRRMEELERRGAIFSEEEAERVIRLYFSRFQNTAVRPSADLLRLQELVGVELIGAVEEILSFSQNQLGRQFADTVKYGLTLHISHAIDRAKQNITAVNPRLSQAPKKYPREFAVAQDCLEMIKAGLHVHLPAEEAAFLALFFAQDGQSPAEEQKAVCVLVVAHGPSTATSLVAACNHLLGGEYAVGFDAGLEENPSVVFSRIKTYLAQKEPVPDVLFLVDMGSFVELAEEIHRSFGVAAKTIPLVSTLHVIEAARKAAMGYSLDVVYADTLRTSGYSKQIVGAHTAHSPAEKKYILTICTTGEGSAMAVKNLLEARLNFDPYTYEIVPLKLVNEDRLYARMRELEQSGSILCVVSSFSVPLDIPSFHLAELFGGQAIEDIQALIVREDLITMICNTLRSTVRSVQPEECLADAQAFVGDTERALGVRLTDNAMAGVLLHLVSLIDRLKSGEPLEMRGDLDDKLVDPRVLAVLHSTAAVLIQKQKIILPDGELQLLACFFHPNNYL